MIFQRLDYIFHNGHNSRLVYMLRSFARYAVPKALLRRRLTSLLGELRSRADKEYILSRVDYYNKLASPPAHADHLIGRQTYAAVMLSGSLPTAGAPSRRPTSSTPTSIRVTFPTACGGIICSAT
ncbi:hypothetical protein IMSAGC022_01161 [Alistipes sp.]|nr:hypothetical protein IMSAGC022_01161 [Alistipes sp.]